MSDETVGILEFLASPLAGEVDARSASGDGFGVGRDAGLDSPSPRALPRRGVAAEARLPARRTADMRCAGICAALLIGFSILAVAPRAHALSSDNDQPMDITANHQKSVASRTGAANDPDVTDLDGNVVITRGSIKITAAHARIYQIPSGARDANAGKFSHMVLTGNPAHMQQLHDGDCGLMTADAKTIDYKPPANLAELTGGVKVVQAGRGESKSEHMIYNTQTGDMESGDSSAESRVHIVMEAAGAKPAPRTDNCGYPPAKPKAAKSGDAKQGD